MPRNNRKGIRQQTSKGRNPELAKAMQGLRSSSAATPHRNKAKYSRTAKYRTDYRQSEDD
jgi:hypothetical protein